MGLSCATVVPVPISEVFAWHERPGALARLLPPWLPLKVVAEATSLRDGRAVIGLPGGLHLSSVHQPDGYDPPYSFVDARPGWRHTHVFSPEGDGTKLEDRVATIVPADRLRPMFAYRHRQLADDLASHARAATMRPGPMTVAVTGSSGLIGSALTAFLTTGGHQVVRLVRRAPRGPGERQWQPDRPAPQMLEGVDAVVHLAGAPVAGRFSPEHKRAVLDSRVAPTQRLAEAAAAAASGGRGPRCFVSASAIGYYGYDRDKPVTEASPPGEGFLADVVTRWEAAAAPAAAGGLRAVQVRTGIVQSPRGGMLQILYPVFWAGLGAKLGSGRQWTSWIGLDDLVDVYYRALVDQALSGPVNAVSPRPLTNAAYTRTLARVLRRPALLTVPSAVPRLVLGPEASREFAEASQRVKPAVLQAAGHQWRFPELAPALRHLLGRAR